MKRIWSAAALIAALFCAWPSHVSRASSCSAFVAASGNLANNSPNGGGLSVTPQCYGAAGDDSANDTAAWNSALDSGYSVFVPCATYRVTGVTKTVSGTEVQGGGSCAVLKNTTNGKTFIYSSTSDVTLRGIRFTRTVASAQSAIYAQHVSRSQLDDIWIESSNEQECIVFDGFSEIVLGKVMLTTCGRDALQVFDSTGFGGAELYCSPGTFIKQAGRDGISIGGGAGGVRVNCHSILNTRYGLRVSTALGGTANAQIFINPNGDFDQNATNVLLEANSFTTMDIVGSWSSSATTGDGYTIAAQTGNVSFNGLRCINNAVNCVNLTGVVAQFGWRGGTITGNGQPSGAGWAITGTNPTLACAGGNLYTANKTGNENVTMTHYNNSNC